MAQTQAEPMIRPESSILEISRGTPLPLGATLLRDGVNFAIFSRNATSVTLVLFAGDDETPLREFPLDPRFNRTGDVWHAFVRGLEAGVRYGYRMDRRARGDSR